MADRLKRGMGHFMGYLARALPTRASQLACAVLAVASGVLCVMPGFNVLNYYSGLAIALIGGLSVGLVNALRPVDKATSLPKVVWQSLSQSLFLAAVPLAILLLNALRVLNCDLWAGLAFYAVGPLATFLIASQWGLTARLFGKTKGRAVLIFLALWIAWIGSDVVSFLTEPPIFAYNAFAGFFSGAVYDDLIRIDSPLLFFRLGNIAQLALALAVISPLYLAHRGALDLSRVRLIRPAQWAAIGLATLCVGALTGASGYLGYDVDRETIEAKLGGEISNERIVLYFDQATIKPDEAALLLEDQTFRLHQLESEFGDTYPTQIRSYVYGSRKQKRRLMGAERTSIAKPWLGEVHLHKMPTGTGIVHHELAHVYFSQYTDHFLGVPSESLVFPKMMLIEGAAMAVEFYGGELTQHEWSAALSREGLAPALEDLVDPTAFLNVNPGRGYILAGSFIRWLIDNHGVTRFKALYQDGDFESAYQDKLTSLLTQWKTFLSTVELPEDAQDRARTRFGRPGVFKRVCPLVIPRLEADAKQSIARGDWLRALEHQRQVEAFMPENATKKISILYSLVQLGEMDEAEKLRLDIHKLENATESRRSQADEIVADGMWRKGERQKALRTYARLLERPLGENRRRSLWAKTLVITDDDLEPILGPYLLSPASDDVLGYLVDAIVDLPENRLALYLAGRRFSFERQPQAAISLLQKSLDAPPLNAEAANELIEVETYRLLGRLYIKERQLEKAATAFRQVRSRSTTDASRRTASDWLARTTWLSTQLGPGKN